MDDLDRAREVPGAADRILATLELFGFEWDGAVEYQSRRGDLYAAAVDVLQAQGRVFRCSCSRSHLARLAPQDGTEPVYPGTCRTGAVDRGQPMALRFLTGEPGHRTGFADRLQGWFEQDVALEVGDFVIRRRDGFHAYQLAVVVDDADQGVTEVVRGCDLLDNTPRQMLLQQALGLAAPAYCHLPLLVEPDGSKLAKSRRSVPLDAARAPALLFQALCLLRQDPPDELRSAGLTDLWAWSHEHWAVDRLRGISLVSL